MHIFQIPALLPKLFPHWIWRGSKDHKTIFLTFDDGPHPEITPWVLKTLESYEAKATFFCVGENAQKYPHIIQLIKDQGHEIGNHTHNHLKGWQYSKQQYIDNIIKATEWLPGNLFRPPYGRIRFSQANRLRKMGLKIVMWSLLSCDYDPKLNREYSLKKMIKHSKNGSIVVFHDSEKAFENLKFLLPRYLEFLTQNGFELKHLG
jgi:peptidoglycan/xylan/chitin deacetylase (PgdA/CDA1 family)